MTETLTPPRKPITCLWNKETFETIESLVQQGIDWDDDKLGRGVGI